MQILGIDLGFGFTKATNGDRSMVVKSVIGEATDQQFGGPMPDARLGDDHLHLEIEDRGIFAGDLAERQSSLRSFTLDQDRFITDSAKVLALAVAAELAEPGTPIHLVTGLPISTFHQKADELERLLRGKHSFTSVAPDGTRSRTVLDIREVKVIPQPFGSMYDMVLDDAGNVGDRATLQQKIGIVDVGFQTSDLTVSDRGVFLERASQSTETGIGRAFATIAGKIREKSGVTVELYRLYEAMDQGHIKIRGDSFDLSRLIEHVLTQLATDIASDANRLWADEWDMDSIVITGGGGAVLAPYLAPLLSGRVLPVQTSRDNRLNNVRGFRRFGLQTWATPTTTAAPAVEDLASDEPSEPVTTNGDAKQKVAVPY
jgi:plasmid segregation protein ParM